MSTSIKTGGQTEQHEAPVIVERQGLVGWLIFNRPDWETP